jgi:acetyltransferase
MDFFFTPRGVAVIGATASTEKTGYSILHNLIQGYAGAIYPVNPRYAEIRGLKCYPTVVEVPDPVDLAIVFVPAEAVRQVVEDCARRGIPGVMIQSAGFAETGEHGRRLQEALVAIRSRTGIRIWGPNCMGLVDTRKRYVFSFVLPSIWDQDLVSGRVSLVVQSGLLAAGFLIDLMTAGRMGIAKACSIGNKADVNECDLMEYLIADPDTGAVALYLESIVDGRRFLELCRRCEKPIVVLKGGRSAAGARAALSHTASLAGDGALLSGVFAQAGVIEATDFTQMMDLAQVLALYPAGAARRPPRVGVLTFSGAAGIVAADFIERHGLEVAELSADSRAALQQVFPDWMPVSSPVDLWPAIELNGPARVYGEALAAVMNDPGVDIVFMHLFVGGRWGGVDFEALTQLARKAGKPLVCWFLGEQAEARRFELEARAADVPVFREIGRAVECMAALARRGEHAAREDRLRPAAEPAEFAAQAGRLLAAAGGGVLDEHRAKQVLSTAGIPVVDEVNAETPAAARAAAERLGFPVVLKGIAPGRVHKTELNLVRLGVNSLQAVEKTFAELCDLLPAGGEVLVQRQVPAGLELIAGFLRDPQFGPCVMIGAGGVLAEVAADRVFAAAPLDPQEALDLLARLKMQRLLDGYRGAPPVDRRVLADLLVNLGRLGAAFPQIREIDINPLIVKSGRPVAVDAAIVLRAS